MTVEELNKYIKSGSLSGIYFFYGEEQYLLSKKIEAIAKKIITDGTEAFNYFKFEGKDADVGEIISVIDQFPQMSEMKLITVKNTGVFNNATTGDFKRIKEISQHIPDDTCIIFVEQTFDKKKLKNISFIEENGGIVNFEYIPLNKLEIWIGEVFKKAEKSISDKEIRHILKLCGQSLAKISMECDKIIDHLCDRIKVTQEDVDAVVEKTLECRAYEMIDSILLGNAEKAQYQLKYLKDTKEEPYYILSLLMTKLSELLMCKLLKEDGMRAEEIGEYFDFKRPAFVVNKTIDESRRFGDKYLKRMLDKGLYYDFECKQGRLSPWSAVEMYVAELIKK